MLPQKNTTTKNERLVTDNDEQLESLKKKYQEKVRTTANEQTIEDDHDIKEVTKLPLPLNFYITSCITPAATSHLPFHHPKTYQSRSLVVTTPYDSPMPTLFAYVCKQLHAGCMCAKLS